MVDAVDHEVPEADPCFTCVAVREDPIAVQFLIGDDLVALAATHLHLLLEAGLVHEALSVASVEPARFTAITLRRLVRVEVVEVLVLQAVGSRQVSLLTIATLLEVPRQIARSLALAAVRPDLVEEVDEAVSTTSRLPVRAAPDLAFLTRLSLSLVYNVPLLLLRDIWRSKLILLQTSIVVRLVVLTR